MSWTTDDGLHEGYLASEFADGQRSIGVSGGGIPDDHVIVNAEYPGGGAEPRYETRPAAEVIGWRITCDCRRPVNRIGYGPGGELLPEADRWVSDLLLRVPSKALEDLEAGKIYAADADVIDVGDREDVEAAVLDRWESEHMQASAAVTRIRAARAQTAAAERDLEAAVAEARSHCVSWETIGRAAGITRQSAHARWRHLDELCAVDGVEV